MQLYLFKVKIPSKRTYYFCDLFEYPQFDSKTHLVQFEILVDPQNVKNVHHVVVYECFDTFVKTEELARECGAVDLPAPVASQCMSSMLLAWGIGM
jgi:hypothetical protein